MAKEKSKTMLVLAVGCGVLMLLVGLAIVGGVFFVKNTVDEFQEDMKDPTAKTLKVLGADQLPEGYYPQFAMDIIMQVAIISNVPKEQDKDPVMGQDGMIYFSIPFVQADQEVKGFFNGETNDPTVLRENGIDIDVDEVIDRGILNLGGDEFMYVVQRGRVQTDGGRVDGLSAVVLIECESRKRTRFAIRYQQDPTPDVPAEQIDLSQTQCSPEALSNFFGFFDFCK